LDNFTKLTHQNNQKINYFCEAIKNALTLEEKFVIKITLVLERFKKVTSLSFNITRSNNRVGLNAGLDHGVYFFCPMTVGRGTALSRPLCILGRFSPA
jgi:hypothetical protein